MRHTQRPRRRIATSIATMAVLSSVTLPAAVSQTEPVNQVPPAESNVYQPGTQDLGAAETDLQNAVDAAIDSGVDVKQQATTDKRVSKYDAEQAIAEAQSDYRTQQQEIERITAEWEQTMAAHEAAMAVYEDELRDYNNENAAREEAIAERDRLIADNERIVVENERLRQAYDEAVAAYEGLMQEYQNAIALREQIQRENAAIENRNQALLDEYQVVLDAYNVKLADYQEKKAFYDAAIQGQIGDMADPTVALNPEYILVDQPFEIIESREDFVLDPTGAGRRARINQDLRWHSRGNNNCSGTLRENDLFYWNQTWTTYNSSFASGCSVQNGDSVRGTWLDRAVDKESGRKLDLTITVSDIVVDSSRPKHPGNVRPIGNRPQVYFYSNSVDNIGLENVIHAKKTYSYRYADTLEPYDKPYYLTIGSLDWSEIVSGNKSAGALAEFTAPGEGVMASFVGEGSYIRPTMQTVYGGASSQLNRAFYVDIDRMGTDHYPDDLYFHHDNTPETFQKIGVTYLVKNNAEVHVGSSYSGTQWREIRQDSATQNKGFNYSHIYNHIMSSYSTVAPQLGEPPHPGPGPTPPELEPLQPLPELPAEPQTPELRQIPLNELPDIPEEPEEPTEPVAPTPPSVTYQLRTVTVMDRGDLKVNKAIDDEQEFYSPGDEILFTLEITNAGEDVLNNVLLHDVPVTGIQHDSLEFLDTAGKPVDGNVINVGTLTSGETLTMSARALLSEDAQLGDVATNMIRGTSPDDPTKGPETDIQINEDLPSDTDGSDEVTVEINEIPESLIDIIKKINGADANSQATAAGLGTDAETMTVTYEITNTGNTTLRDVTLTDDIPEINEQLIGYVSDAGVNGEIVLEPGQTVIFTLDQVVAPEVATFHNNTGTVTGTVDDPRVPEGGTVTDEDPAWAFRYPVGGVELPNTGSVGLVGLGALLMTVLSGAGIFVWRRNKSQDELLDD